MNYAKFVNEHTDMCSQVCDLLTSNDMGAEAGELLLLWLVGLSMGKRQVSLVEHSPQLTILALGWQIGAGDTDG